MVRVVRGVRVVRVLRVVRGRVVMGVVMGVVLRLGGFRIFVLRIGRHFLIIILVTVLTSTPLTEKSDRYSQVLRLVVKLGVTQVQLHTRWGFEKFHHWAGIGSLVDCCCCSSERDLSRVSKRGRGSQVATGFAWIVWRVDLDG